MWFASAAPGLEPEERGEHYTVIRRGTELTCRFHAFRWLVQRRHEIDLIIDEVNTLPWLSPLVSSERTILLIHQLAREVWWAEAPWPAAAVGFAMEPAYLRLYRNADVITISDSSARSLREVGLRGRIQVVECPLEPPFESAANPIPATIGYVGRVTASKRIGDIVRALALVRERQPQARLLVVGGGTTKEFHKLRKLADELGVLDAVEFTGRLSDEERDRRLGEVDVLAMASLREGWGLVVSEAARWRIPAVAYPVPGLCDSIVDGRTGLLAADQTPRALAGALMQLIGNRAQRDAYGTAAADMLLQFSEERFAQRFCEAVERHG